MASSPARPWESATDYLRHGATVAGIASITLALVVSRLVPVLGWLLALITWGAALRYSFELLRFAAHGEPEPPEWVLTVPTGLVWRFLGLQLLLIGLPVALWQWTPLPLWLLLLPAVALQPAIVLTLVLRGDWVSALNPGQWWRVLVAFGPGYLVLLLWLGSVQLIAWYGGAWLGSNLPGMLGYAVTQAVAVTGLYLCFHRMGWEVHGRQAELDFTPTPLAVPLTRPADRDQRLLDELVPMKAARDWLAIDRRLRAESRERALGVALLALHREALLAIGDRWAINEQAGRYLQCLLVMQQSDRALALLKDCMAEDPDFTLLDPLDGARMADKAAARGLPRLALAVLDAQLRKHGREPEAVHWALTRRGYCRQLELPEVLPDTVWKAIRRGCKDTAALAQLESG
ncbi:MAG: hypothetical protein MUE46_19045 [Xanthomonadales bacterium]|jgi:hypothetical protein|nr:hypothetical protein [Xanthomonadales bacterium]